MSAPDESPSPSPDAARCGHTHRCMRCNHDFACMTPGVCTANFDVLPTIVWLDGGAVRMEQHCEQIDGQWVPRAAFPVPSPSPDAAVSPIDDRGADGSERGQERCARCGTRRTAENWTHQAECLSQWVPAPSSPPREEGTREFRDIVAETTDPATVERAKARTDAMLAEMWPAPAPLPEGEDAVPADLVLMALDRIMDALHGFADSDHRYTGNATHHLQSAEGDALVVRGALASLREEKARAERERDHWLARVKHAEESTAEARAEAVDAHHSLRDLRRERDEALATAEGPSTLRDLAACFLDAQWHRAAAESRADALARENEALEDTSRLWALLTNSGASLHCNYTGGPQGWTLTDHGADGCGSTEHFGASPIDAVRAYAAAPCPARRGGETP